MEQIKKTNYKTMLNSDRIIIDFYADWCGPCKMLAPIFEDVSSKITTTKFAKLNIDSLNEYAKEHKVGSIPTLILFEKGKEIKRFNGFLSKDDLMNFIK